MSWFSESFSSVSSTLETITTVTSWATGGLLPIYGSHATLSDRLDAKREADQETLREIFEEPGAILGRAGDYVGGAAGALVEGTLNAAAAAAGGIFKSKGWWIAAAAAGGLALYLTKKR